MIQFAKEFRRYEWGEDGLDRQLNDFLKEHPTCKVDSFQYSHVEWETLFVLFSVYEE